MEQEDKGVIASDGDHVNKTLGDQTHTSVDGEGDTLQDSAEGGMSFASCSSAGDTLQDSVEGGMSFASCSSAGDILQDSVEGRLLFGSSGSAVSFPTYLVLPDNVPKFMTPIELKCLQAGGDAFGAIPQEVAEPVPTPGSRCHVKRIQWFKKDVSIILQNENGPCPLIAIANVMLLRRHLVLEPTTLVITTDKLVQLIAECVVEAKPRIIPGRDFQELVQDSLESLAGLSHGLNVDVKFSGVTEFENTRELAIFTVLDIALYHGWVRYSEPGTVHAVGNLSYNQLTEKILADRYSGDDKRMIEALTAENFLCTSASQLTYEGLCQLVSIMKFAEVSVLFRNNHFSTVLKFHTASPMDKLVADSSILHLTRAELYILVTDQGFLNEPQIVWETLTNIENDSTFVDANFIIPKRKDMPTNPVMSAADRKRQEENDANLARQMQQAEDRIAHDRMVESVVNTFDPLRAAPSAVDETLFQLGEAHGQTVTPPAADKVVVPVAPLVDLMVGLPPEVPADGRLSRSATEDHDPRAGGTRSKKTDKGVGKEPEPQPQTDESCVIL